MRCGNGADVCESAEGHWVRLGLTLGFPQQLPHYPTTLVAHMIHTTHRGHQQTAPGPKCEETDLAAAVRQSEKG